jgi:alkanesulfonate monooxygenase SsuD/methylene tetrahydromethanopterin reductase-like flavin-dependent oxidoreductase (luciferase family)
MQFSAWPSPTRSTDEILDIARQADRAGWHGVWFADHYMPNTDDGATVDGDTHEAWAMLPAIAMTTRHVRIGPLVSPTSIHHPAVLANRAATIDHLSQGRFVLGIGAGWQVNEHRAYGIELPDPGPRVTRFEEAIQIVRSLLSERRTTFEGRYYRVTDAPAQPAPVQQRLPILVGTGSPRMLRIAARFADEWNTWGDLALAEQRATAFLDACEAVGRDPGSVRRSVQALVLFPENDEHAAKLRQREWSGRALIGSPAELVDAVGRYVELGFDELIVPDWTFGKDPAERADSYARFDTEIATQFRS